MSKRLGGTRRSIDPPWTGVLTDSPGVGTPRYTPGVSRYGLGERDFGSSFVRMGNPDTVLTVRTDRDLSEVPVRREKNFLSRRSVGLWRYQDGTS